jgi:hypothetical protein
MRTPIEDLPRPMLEADKAVLILTEGLTSFTEGLMDFLTIWNAIPGVEKIPWGGLMGKMEGWEKQTNELQDSIATKLGEVQTALDAMDASDAVTEFGKLKTEGDLLPGTFATMADTAVSSVVTLNQLNTNAIRGDIDKLTSVADIARDAAGKMADAWEQALRGSTAIFQEIARHIDEQSAALQSLPWTMPAVPNVPSTPNTTRSIPGVGIYGEGGIVPGPRGKPQLAILHGDEEVLTSEERHRGVVNNFEFHITINGSTDETLRAFEQVMNKALRHAGFGGSNISAGAFVPN